VDTQPAECPFCNINDDSVVLQSETAFAIHDGYPISPDHTLVISRQHVATLFELPRHEQLALWDLVDKVRERLIEEHHPDGFNIGLNDGVAAGQTVPHVHIHVIPRYDGDVPDPRGGIRWVIPDKAPYWE
jgi:diadenosine tetraphosphate (Ap4A) HIT family hydrolase